MDLDINERYYAIAGANQAGHIGLCRELCEAFLRDHPDHGPALLMLAMQLTELRLYAEAERMIDRAEQVVPAHRAKLIWAQRGHLFEARGSWADAEAVYLRVHQAETDDATYLIYAGLAASEQGDVERALDHYTRATRCREGCLDEAHYNRGGKLLALKRYTEAIEAYREALRIDPDYELAKKRLLDLELLINHVQPD